jgi:NADH-quinone oxidoreductase subunit J
VSAPVIIFILVAFVAVTSAVMVITQKDPVHSALWLILNLVSLAVIYYLLNAPFLMAVQLIVYAGAIVVLFLFVVMLLAAGKEEGAHPHLGWLRPAAWIAAAAFLVGIVTVGWLQIAPPDSGGTPTPMGDPASIGRLLYSRYLLPFEATSILLLAALVGALYLGRRYEGDHTDDYGETEGTNV